MVNFKLKDVTWSQRKKLAQSLEAAGITSMSLAKAAKENGGVSMPYDFIELAFQHGLEGFEDVEKLNELSDVELQTGAQMVYLQVFFKSAEEKKS